MVFMVKTKIFQRLQNQMYNSLLIYLNAISVDKRCDLGWFSIAISYIVI